MDRHKNERIAEIVANAQAVYDRQKGDISKPWDRLLAHEQFDVVKWVGQIQHNIQEGSQADILAEDIIRTRIGIYIVCAFADEEDQDEAGKENKIASTAGKDTPPVTQASKTTTEKEQQKGTIPSSTADSPVAVKGEAIK